MKNSESLFNQIKSAAENAETKDFSGMDKVWNRVEEKLDNKEDKKAMLLWKKIAVAASLLLFVALGYQFFINNSNKIKSTEVVTIPDSIQKITPPNNEIVTVEPISQPKPGVIKVTPVIKKEAEQILQKQINTASQVAKADDVYSIPSEANSITITGYSSAPVVAQGYSASDNLQFKSKKAAMKDVELFMDKNNVVSEEKKEEPLVVINNKVENKNLKNLEFDQEDSLVVLNEPLYIINGVEYTEQELFGPNPTSPYAPLKKQDIETISILQDEKAIEIYGEKGKKGVVIITTKNAKPINANATKKTK